MKKKQKKSLNITVYTLICLLFAGAMVLEMTGMFKQKVFAATLTGWSYRKEFTLSRSSGAVTNYQMKLLVGESSGATGENVDCGGYVQSDFDDLRFTTTDGATLLDYWIESITGTSPNRLATVWIEFNSIGTSATTFYMYYGNPSAVSYSNGTNTFLFFDDAESGVVTSKWTDNSVNLVSSYSSVSPYAGSKCISVTHNSTSNNGSVSQNAISATPNFSISMRARQGAINNSFRYYLIEPGGILRVANHSWGYSPTGSALAYYNNGPAYVDTTYDYSTSWDLYELFGNGDTDTLIWKKNGTTIAADSDVSTWTSFTYFYWNSDAVNDVLYMDDVFIRQWFATEPSWGTWGGQQILGGTISVDTTPIDFGDVLVDSSNNIILTIGNTGTGDLTGSVSGLANPFSCTANCNYTIPGGSNITISLRFKPESEGSFSDTLVLSGGGGANIFLTGNGFTVPACQEHNVWGYAWSDNIGWISFSCKNEDAVADYGVDIDNSDLMADQWELSGYAWSDNIGWITFNRSQLSGCPSGTGCYSWVDTSVGTLNGWARACSVFASGCSGSLKSSGLGGWDGWLKFYDNLANKAYIDFSVSPAEFREYMWGNMNIGWVSLNHKNEDAISNYAVYTNVALEGRPTVIFTIDPDNNDNYCGAVDGQGMVSFEWQYSDEENLETEFDIRISPVGEPSNYVIEKTISATCSDTEPPILCTNTWSAYVGDKAGQLAYDQTYNWEVQVHSTESISGWMQAPGNIGTFTTASGPYPWVEFTWDPPAPLINATTTFDSSSSTTYGNFPAYSWQFSADAVPNISSLENPLVRFTTGGDKSVTLTISDSNGSCTEIRTITATLPLPDWIEIPPE